MKYPSESSYGTHLGLNHSLQAPLGRTLWSSLVSSDNVPYFVTPELGCQLEEDPLHRIKRMKSAR